MSTPPKGRADYLELGDWNALCYECGAKFKASDLIRHWQGYYVCRQHWEPRHPQDFARGVQDVQTPSWTQPVPADQFVVTCTLEGMSAIPYLAMPGCMIPGRLFTPTGAPYSFCPINSNQCRADVAAADCAIVGDVS